MNQTIKIIGGQYRGKKINFSSQNDLRPTPNRVKETVFNWLMNDIKGANCLDAFAGSGSLGFEAYSRGASTVTFIEASTEVYKNLLKVAASFKANSNELKIIFNRAEDYFKVCKEQFDLIFLDPPFAQQNINFYIELITQYSLLKKGGLIYIEAPSKPELPFQEWNELKSKIAGQVSYGLYERI